MLLRELIAILCGLTLLSNALLAGADSARAQAPYGTWASRIRATDLARSTTQLSDVRVAGGKLYWVESRPAEGGRYVVVTPQGRDGIESLIPDGFSSRTRVHEYGGTAYVVSGRTLYFSNFADQRLYRHDPGGTPLALTPEGYRYADCVAAAGGDRLFCVREDHTGEGEAKNTIVAVPTAGGTDTVLFDDSDFVAHPRPSPDGRYLAWVAWDHPNMPWGTTTLYVAKLGQSRVRHIVAIAGGHRESVVEPAWDADGALYFISDRAGWWNLYRWKAGKSAPVLLMDAEVAQPQWALGQASYALTGDGRAALRYSAKAVDKLGVLDLKSGQLRPLDLPFVSFMNVQLLSRDTAIAIAASAYEDPVIIKVDLKTGAHRVVRAPSDLRFDPALISKAQTIEFPTSSGDTAYGFYYPPTNPAFTAPVSENPPLLVRVHGGPTAQSTPALNLVVQYWTSRGFAVMDVNYGGSSGYGRRYRERLNGKWGIVDVEDAVAAAKYLTGAGRVDPQRIAIRGASAGGFTTLAALAFTDVFKAGASHFGVSDLAALARDTHKFESRYLDTLVGPLPASKAVYQARSPIRHLGGFNEPLITFQGVEDPIVPRGQSQMITQALKVRGVPVAYLEFAGEQHGFRKAETIVRAYEAELYFYGRVFGFTPADHIAPVQIENLR